jgi:N-acetylglucosaminyldiphosphoundecaprenol N-acetyl-beta-D-mannosaminyltransferase
MSDRVEFLGLCFDSLTLSEVLDRIELFVEERIPRKIFTPNVALLMWSRKNRFLRDVYRTSDIVTVDGMAIHYALHLVGTPVKETLSASLMFYPLLELAQERGWRVYLLGAKEPVLQAAVRNLKQRFPSLRIVGARNGYFDADNPSDVVCCIRKAAPDILLLGMSTPMKERFTAEHLDEMNVPVTLGVGGMFDIAAGVAKFAPRWVRVLCLEWLYRLLQEPRRMWKRYLTTNVAFLWLLQKELVRRRLLGRAAAAPADALEPVGWTRVAELDAGRPSAFPAPSGSPVPRPGMAPSPSGLSDGG